MKKKTKRIGLFGGTFDPVHNGHISIAESFLRSEVIDELWVILNPSPPHKQREEFAPFRARLKMLEAAFEPLSEVLVTDLETNLPAPTYTLQTVAYLKAKYPDYAFYLCVGKDSFLTFNTWHKWREILEYCSLLVAERPTNGMDTVTEPQLLGSVTFVNHSPIDVSSTEIRRRIADGKPIEQLVPGQVAAIIDEEDLYSS